MSGTNFLPVRFFAFLCCSLLATGASAQSPAYNFYYGNLHAHTEYSDGNQDATPMGIDTPLESYQFADASQHFDFLGISEHNHSQAGMQLANYALGRAQATQATTPTFVALHGTEWGVISGGGHMLVYGVNELFGWEAGNYDTYVPRNDYQALMRQINRRPGAFALLAHPDRSDYGGLMTSAPFSPTADSALVGTPFRSGPATTASTLYDQTGTSYEARYRDMLALGYHVGISLDHDNHKNTFGRSTTGRTVVLAPALTEADLLQALRARRFYASDDWNAQVTLELNGQPMGSILTDPAPAALTLTYADPDNEPVRSITLLRGEPGSGTNAVTVATAATGANVLSYTDPAPSGAAYYYAIIVQADGDKIITSPIWYTRGAVVSGVAAAAPTVPVEVFPNPLARGAGAEISYYLPEATPVRVRVLDALGRKVLTPLAERVQPAGPHSVRISSEQLAPGLYIVRLRLGQQLVVKRLVVK